MLVKPSRRAPAERTGARRRSAARVYQCAECPCVRRTERSRTAPAGATRSRVNVVARIFPRCHLCRHSVVMGFCYQMISFSTQNVRFQWDVLCVHRPEKLCSTYLLISFRLKTDSKILHYYDRYFFQKYACAVKMINADYFGSSCASIKKLTYLTILLYYSRSSFRLMVELFLLYVS